MRRFLVAKASPRPKLGRMRRCFLFLTFLAIAPVWANDDEATTDADATADAATVEQLTGVALESVVVIYHEGRTAGQGATGTGFIIDEEGLIATNWHVINDRRRIQVELRDGTVHQVTEVHAWDRVLDLALIRIESDEALPSLELGDSDAVVQGQHVIALGNPHGLKFSVVEGVVSGLRNPGEEPWISSQEMVDVPFPLIQVAMPIESGNSGGPLIDRDGKVQGIISMKSMVTQNLGFAVPVNGLKILLGKPNPMPMDRWATIGALDARRWKTRLGADWSQRAGRIRVKGFGEGFGGRSLCLSTEEVPEEAYDLEVEVKLADERGAAGLVFASDGEDVHYGFYPSGGNLRLTRFSGPDVLSWEILEQLEAPEYRPGEWNRIRVRVEPETIRCFVNESEVTLSNDRQLRGGKVGLCKFRDTEAEFRQFQLGAKLDRKLPNSKVLAEFTEQLEKFLREGGDGRRDLLDQLTDQPLEGRASLREMNAALELRVAELNRLVRDANAAMIGKRLTQVLSAEEAEIDLVRAALFIAKIENEELEMAAYEEIIADMAAEIRDGLKADANEAEIVNAVRKFMFEESGFHGSRLDYQNASNSYLNEVIDDREGLPITLSVVFVEVARRAGAKTVHGVGLPGHFVVGYRPEEDGEQHLIDVFDGGTALDREAARRLVARTQNLLVDEMLEPVTKRAIIARMLRNLIELRKQEGEPMNAMPYIAVLLEIDPENAAARLDRAILRIQEGNVEGAKTDFRWLIQAEPPGIDVRRLRRFYETL